MVMKQRNPVRCPANRSDGSQRLIPTSVPAFGRPGFLSSQGAPPGVPVARNGGDLCRTGGSLPSEAGPVMRNTGCISGPAGPAERRGAHSFKRLLAPALAFVVLVLQAAAAEAACGKKHRVSHRDSECLSAWWENHNSMYQHNVYHVRNMCSSQGRVVAKVDLAEEMDRTMYLDNGATRTGQTKFRIRWIYCCSDLSTLCNRSDLERADEGESVPDAMEVRTAPDNDTPPSVWLPSFGRAMASEHVELLGAQLAAGNRPQHLTVGGHRIEFASGPDGAHLEEDEYTGAGRWQVRTERELPGLFEDEPGESVATSMTGRDLLSDTSFRFVGGENASGRWSGWGSTAPLEFAESDGTLGKGRLELLGTDYARGRLLAGVALSHGSGADAQMSGGFRGMGASLHGVHPYLRLAVDDRWWIWSAFGFWTGDMMLHDGDGAASTDLPGRWRTELDMSMAAVGAGGALLTANEADGFALAATADAYVMRIGSGTATVPGEGDVAEAEVARLRLALDGSRIFWLGPRHRLAALIGVGLLREGGDGSAGTSVGLKASLRHASPGQSISAGLDVIDGDREYTFGWRTQVLRRAVPGFGLALRAARRELAIDYWEPEYVIDLGVTVTR